MRGYRLPAVQGHRRAISRCLARSIYCAAALALLCTASDAVSQTAGQPTQATVENPFSRWFRPLSAAATPAAPATAQPAAPVRKPRIARVRKRAKSDTARSVPAGEQRARHGSVAQPVVPETDAPAADPAWPHAEDNVGRAMITPLTVKTVREQLEPAPEVLTVSENELSEIDRAAPSEAAGTTSTRHSSSTDGSGRLQNEIEQDRVFANAEMKATSMRPAWLEPALLMIAGALAGLAASRLFA